MATKDLIAKIILKGETDPTLQKAFNTASKLADQNIDKMRKYGDAATKAMKFVGTAAVAGLGASAKAAIDYESAFAGVMKTVNETGTTTYEDLSTKIRQMAKEMPASAAEIAGVAEIAGQLGIKADDIMKFSEVMINLGETTNLSSEEAASAIAKFFNITGTSMDSVDKFGSTLVHLGNNAATTENDIMNMASRIASSGNQIGLSEPQVLALAASLSSVGMEAEAGGTAISTVMTKIDKSVATSDETLSTWASTAGMSVGQFSQLWEKDAYGAMQKVIGGMGDVTKNGGNLNLILEELGITGIREADTMKRLASASGMMGEMTEIANQAWNENSALSKEANTRYATMASRISILKNRFYDVGITVGQALMPHLETLMTKLEQVNWDAAADKIVAKIQWVADNFGKVKVALGIFATAFATFKVANFINDVNDAVKAVKDLHSVASKMQTFTKLKSALSGLAPSNVISNLIKLKNTLAGLPFVQGLVSAAQSLMNITFMGCPVVWIVAGVAALVAAFVLLWKKCDGFREFWIGLWEKVKSATSTAGAWLKNFFTVTIPNGFQTMVTFFQQLPSKIWTFLVNVVTKIGQWGANLWAKAKEVGRNFITAVTTFFQQLPSKIGYALGFAAGRVARWAVDIYQTAKVKIPQFINAVVTFFKQLPSKIWTWLTSTAQKVTAWGTRIWTIGKEKARAFLNAVVTFFKQLPSKVWNWLTNAAQKTVAWGARMLSIGKAKARAFLTAVVNFIKQLPGKLWTWFTNCVQKVVQWGSQMVAKGKAAAIKLKDTVVNTVKQIPSKLLSVGKDIVKGLWNGIKSAGSWLKGKIGSFVSGVVKGFTDGFKIKSPSLIMNKAVGKFLPMGLGEGITQNAKYALSAVKDMGTKVISAAQKISPTIGVRATGAASTASNINYSNPSHAKAVGGNILDRGIQGVSKANGGNNISFTFAPVVSGGNAEENRKMLKDEQAEFEKHMEAYIKKKGRLAFA